MSRNLDDWLDPNWRECRSIALALSLVAAVDIAVLGRLPPVILPEKWSLLPVISMGNRHPQRKADGLYSTPLDGATWYCATSLPAPRLGPLRRRMAATDSQGSRRGSTRWSPRAIGSSGLAGGIVVSLNRSPRSGGDGLCRSCTAAGGGRGKFCWRGWRRPGVPPALDSAFVEASFHAEPLGASRFLRASSLARTRLPALESQWCCRCCPQKAHFRFL